MNRKSHIVPVNSGGKEQDQENRTVEPDVLILDHEDQEQPWDDGIEAETSLPRRWMGPALAILIVAGWTGFFGWVHHTEMLAGATPALWSEWIVAWATPVLLVVAGWLLAMRTSTREAARFNDAARTLSEESRLLEHRLVNVNRELSLAREFITAQGRDLESFGRMASERLSTHADKLKSLVLENDAQVQAIATVSTTAMENMDRLRGDLPVIANSARDVANQIGAAGRTAEGQLESLVQGFHRLNDFGSASERQVQSVQAQVEKAIAEMSTQTMQLEEIATARFAALAENSETFRSDLGRNEIEALAAIRRRAEALQADINRNREALDRQEAECLEAMQARMAALQQESADISADMLEGAGKTESAWLEAAARLRNDLEQALGQTRTMADAAIAQMNDRLTSVRSHVAQFESETHGRRKEIADDQARELADLETRLAAFDAHLAERREDQLRLSRDFAEQGDALKRRLETLHAQIAAITSQGEHIQDDLAQGLATVAENISSGRNLLDGMDKAVAELTDAGIRLLEVIHASSQHSREHLPSALAEAEDRLATFRTESETANLMLKEASRMSEDLSAHIILSRKENAEAMREAESFHARLADNTRVHRESFAEMRAELASLAESTGSSAAQMSSEIGETVARISGMAREVLVNLEQDSGAITLNIAQQIGADGAAAMEETMRQSVQSALTELAGAAEKAMAQSKLSASQLRDQLAKVDELAGNLEARINHTRAQAEEKADNDFARRVALITEALNSHAIDIAKALSTEITDTAWSSYLKGDRGIFTRRAVRLLDNASARAVLELHEQDRDFREHVNRYVHDFEAMLRTLLSTRDGHALGVTLLSSDMGKLYVALAQAIERLRA